MADIEKCNIEFLNGIKSIVGKADSKALLKAIADRAQNLKDKGINEDEAINQAANEFAERTRQVGKNETRERLINIKVHKSAMDFVKKFPSAMRGLNSFVGGVEGSLIKGAKNSVDAAQKDMLSRIIGRFSADIEKNNLEGALRDRRNHEAIMEERYNPGITGNKEAAQIAKIVRTAYGTGRAFINKFGGAVADLLEYTGRQIHNPERMLKLSENAAEHRTLIKGIAALSKDPADRRQRIIDAAYSIWSKYILTRLDQDRTFEGVTDRDKFLKDIFTDIVEGRYNTQNPDEFGGELEFKGPKNTAKKVSARRVLHFKDGKAAFEYNNRYGHGSFPELFYNTARGMAENAGGMRMLGTNMRPMFDRVKEDSIVLAKKQGLSKSNISRLSQRAENTFREVSGELRTPIDNMLAKIGMGSRILQVLSKMGSVTLSAIPDIGNKADELRANGMGFLESEFKAFTSTFTGLGPQQKYIADLSGTYFESLPKQLAHLFGTTDGRLGQASKLMQKTYDIVGITKLDQANRQSYTDLLARRLVLESHKKFNNLDLSLQKRLNEHGMEEKEWDLLRKPENIQRPYGNKRFITPDGARFFTDESIKEYLENPDAKPHEIENVRDTMEFNMRTHFMTGSDNINMMAQATERAIMHQGLDPNTAAGQAMRGIMQFKGFMLSMTRRKLGRIFGNAIENGWTMGNVLTMSNVQQLTQLAISLTGYGYLALTMKDIVAGKMPRDPTKFKTMISSMLQGGAAALYGDFLIGNYERGAGQSFTDTFGGAGLSTVNQVWNLFSRLERMDHPGTAAFYFLKSNMPFVNLWYAKAAFNYLFLYGMQEKMNPGSLSRMQRNLEENYGQHFIFDPNTYAKQF